MKNTHGYSIVLTICIFTLAVVPMKLVSQDSVENRITVIGEEVNDVEKIHRSPATYDIVPLDSKSGTITSASEVLSERVGVQIKRYGGLGSYSTISIRGSNANQVMVYFDGVPLNDAVLGEFNIESITLEGLDRIEIYRGNSPSRFGISGIGGIVNLVPKRPEKGALTGIALSYGSYNTSKITLSRVEKKDSFHYDILLDRTGSDGDFMFIDDNGTPVYNTGDDQRKKRENNDHVSYSANAGFGITIGTYFLGMRNDFYFKEQGLPGIGSNSALHVRFETMRNITSFSVKKRELFIPGVDGEIKLYYHARRDSYDDSENEIGLGAQNQKGFFNVFGGSFHGEAVLERMKQVFNLMVSYLRETYHRETNDPQSGTNDKGPEQIRDRIGLSLEDEISLFDDRWRLVPQLRQDTWRDDFYIEKSPYVTGYDLRNAETHNKTSWQIASKLFLVKKMLYIHGTAGVTYRIPTFTELFGDRGVILGNPTLLPERAFNKDAGVGISVERPWAWLDRLSCRYAYFNNSIDDIIIFIYNSQMTMIAQNVSAARVSGHEVTFSASMLAHFTLTANYTFQKAIDKSDIPYYRGNYLPHRPLHEATVTGRAHNSFGSISYTMNYTGSNFRDRANSEFYYLDRRIFHNIELQYTQIPGHTLVFEIKNLTNNTTQDIVGYPLPGRSFYGTLKYVLREDK